MRRIGFLINPIAGLGGPVGLKGSDGVTAEALERGGVPRSGLRAEEMLNHIHAEDLLFITCSGDMGEAVLNKVARINSLIVYYTACVTTPEDTKEACRKFLDAQVELILFCGGDGTARDVFDVVGSRVPVLGIPAGVKMYSGVFAISPAAAAALVDKAGSMDIRDAEILDVDETAYREGTLSTCLYGIARVPFLKEYVQTEKHVIEEQDEERAKDEIARFISEVLLPDTIYIIGAGSTTERIARHLGVRKTLLGVDVIKNGRLLAADVDEKALLTLLKAGCSARIIISPIGAQGFIFGRGTQQISSSVIRRVGPENVIVVATPAKCRETPVLHIDTGDALLDCEFPDSIQIISGYRIAQRKSIGKIRKPDIHCQEKSPVP